MSKSNDRKPVPGYFDVNWMLRELAFLIPRMFIAGVLAIIGIFFLAYGSKSTARSGFFLFGQLLAIASIALMVYFIVSRFRASRIAEKQKLMMKNVAPGRKKAYLIVLIGISTLLFVLAYLFEGESENFQKVIMLMDGVLWAALAYSFYRQKHDEKLRK